MLNKKPRPGPKVSFVDSSTPRSKLNKKKRSKDSEFEVTSKTKKQKPLQTDRESTKQPAPVVKSRAVAVLPAAAGQNATTLNVREQRSIVANFGANAQVIIDMLESNDNDGALTLLKKRLLQTVIDVLPDAEKFLRDSGGAKGTYAFVTLISQIRELITDIQSDHDRRHIARNICEEVLRPAFMDIAQNLITQHHGLRKSTEHMLKPDQLQPYSNELRELAKSLAQDMTTKYLEVETKVFNALK
jgi:hypothetical protein